MSYSPEATIYLADNASTDSSIEFVKTNYPDIKIIQNEGNFGYAQGYNVALKDVEEPYFCLLNSDVEVTENWLKPILEIFEKEKNVAIIQPKILDFKNKSLFEYAGAAGGFIDKYGYPYCRGRIFETVEKDNGQYDDFYEIFWASGACFFIRKEVFNQLGGFDESFFAHQEEIDLCWRSKNAGYKTCYTFQSIIYHVGGATLKESNPKKTFLNFRNSLLMLVKNLPEGKILPIIFTRLFLDGIAGIQFILKGKLSHCWAIIKAHFHFYHLLNKYLKKRTNNQTESYFKTNSIVYNYFIKGGKVFEEN
ncbi:glycosyl transferase family 2 [Flavobacterium lutivivi]|nr:glycosyl transferase family 2 [Flavobacterium lutivivi]